MLLSWCAWHIQVYALFNEFFYIKWYEVFVTVVERKGFHCNYNRNDSTTTYPLIRQLIKRYWCKRKCGCAKHARVTGSDPRNRVSHVWMAWQTRNNMQATYRARCKHGHLRQHTCIRSRASSRGYTFKACKRDGSGSVQCRGNRRSRDDRSGSSCTQRR